MPVVKKRNQQTETRLLLEGDEPIELPPAEIEDSAVLAQFENFKPFVPELLAALRAGTVAEPVPVMLDGSTFAVHGQTRTFWVKLWHTANSELTRIERAQIISCLPSTRGVQVVIDDYDDDETDEDMEEDDDYDDDDDYDESDDEHR
jgi:S-adenosylmethionine:diacylglycerol 3-amino-3-carboxypropyl transferase